MQRRTSSSCVVAGYPGKRQNILGIPENRRGAGLNESILREGGPTEMYIYNPLLIYV